MREIKFRAWDGSKMYLPENSDKEVFHLLADGTIVETHEHGYEGHELTSPRGDNWVLMQFTGLKDKNGKEIYEEDVADIETKGKIFRGEVRWNPQSASFIFINGNRYLEIISMAQFGGEDYPVIHLSGVEIIGNIYENPELLK